MITRWTIRLTAKMNDRLDSATACDFCSAKTPTLGFWTASGALSIWEDDQAFGARTHEDRDSMEVWNLHICQTCLFTRYIDTIAAAQESPLQLWARLLLGPTMIFVGALVGGSVGVYGLATPGFFLTIFGWASFPSAWRKFRAHGDILRIDSIPAENVPESILRSAEDYQRKLESSGDQSLHKLPAHKPRQNLTTIHKHSIIAVAYTPAELLQKLDSQWKAIYASSISA